MFKIIFTLMDNNFEEEVVIRFKEGTQEEAEDYAKSEANKYLRQFEDLAEINWSVVNEVVSGFIKRED